MTCTFVKVVAAGLVAATAAFVTTARAQTDFPTKPVRVVMPYSAGSGVDAVLRLVGEKLSSVWGQQVVIDNKPGANGWLALGEVKRAPADGHTLVTVDATHMTLHPSLYSKMPFEPAKDFEPVVPLYKLNFFIVVRADAPWRNVAELLADAKAKNGLMTYGTWGLGSVGHVGTAMLESATGTKMTHVPYKELGQLYTAVSTGEVEWAFGAASTTAALAKAKKLKLLAYAGPARMAGFADVPTVSESGGPSGFELSTWVALYAPKGTPKQAVDRIQAGIAKVLADPEVRQRLATSSYIEPWVGSPTDLTKAAETDSRRYAEVVKRSKISLD